MKKDRLSYSALSQFSKSPNHLLSYWNKEQKPATEAQQFGKLLHKMILEPEEMLQEYIQYEGRRAGKAWTDFQELHLSKTIVTSKLYFLKSVLSCSFLLIVDSFKCYVQ